MENNNLNIIQLFEKNPLTRLTKTYENKLINKIKENFTDSQQQLFVGSFYLYLNYNTKKDFVVDFDNIWKWIGFSRKSDAKRVLLKNFIEGVDYTIKKAATEVCGPDISNEIHENKVKNLGGSGMNKEKITLTVNTFKKFCLKASTKKADEIHDYYIKLEELLQETLNEETEELRLQLENTNNENIVLKKKLTKKYNDKKYPEGNCIYVISNQLFPNYYKIGISKKFDTRLNSYDSLCPLDHEVLYFRLAYCNEEIEKIIKKTFSEFVIQTNKEEWFKLDDGNILIYAVKNICDTIDLILPRQTEINTEILVKNTRELKNPLLLPEKECTACKKVKSLESFHYASEHTDGRENRCKDCAKTLQKKYIENKRETEEIPTEKECTSCKKTLPLEEYYVDNEKFDKRGTKCKQCFLEVRKANRNYIEISEYCCSNCKITKPIDDFHKLSSSHTGHKYRCKVCELEKAKERYTKKRILDLENNEINNTEKDEERKMKQKESYDRRISTKLECPCGSITNLAQKSKHEKTKKHQKYLENLS